MTMLSNELFKDVLFSGAHTARQIDSLERKGVSPDDPRYRALKAKLDYKDQNTKDRMEKTSGKIKRGEGADFDPNENYVAIERRPGSIEEIKDRGYIRAHEDPEFPSIIGPEAEQRVKFYKNRGTETDIDQAEDRSWWLRNERNHPRVSLSRAGAQITNDPSGNRIREENVEHGNQYRSRVGYGDGDFILVKANTAHRVPTNEYHNMRGELNSNTDPTHTRDNPNLEERFYPKLRRLYNQDQEDKKFKIGRKMTLRRDGSIYRGIGPKPWGYERNQKRQNKIVGELGYGVPVTRKYGAVFRHPTEGHPDYPSYTINPATKDHPEFFKQPLNSTYPALNR